MTSEEIRLRAMELASTITLGGGWWSETKSVVDRAAEIAAFIERGEVPAQPSIEAPPPQPFPLRPAKRGFWGL